MVGADAGTAALAGWAAGRGAGQVDGVYIAIDHDVLDGDDGSWSLQMPEPGGLSLERLP